MGPQEPERRPRGQREREGGPGRPNPSQPRARLPPPGAPGEVRHERDNGKPAAEAAPRNREPIAVVIWHGLQHDLLLLGAQEERVPGHELSHMLPEVYRLCDWMFYKRRAYQMCRLVLGYHRPFHKKALY